MYVLSTSETTTGDFNRNGMLDANDIDQLAVAIRNDSTDTKFDVDMNGTVDIKDHTSWVTSSANTFFGDANLDGEFRSSDLVLVLVAGEYEDELVGNSGWATGDWNGDGDFTTGDFVVAFEDGGYEQGPRTTTRAIPEPASRLVFLASLIFTLAYRPI